MGSVVVTGGAGFVGSHLVDALLAEGERVVVVDNFLTGRRDNLAHLDGAKDLTVLEHDVTQPFDVEEPVSAVLHLASPASPIDYALLPLETMAVGSAGTWNALELARRHDARFVMASTSETYGDPLVHPQVEDYWGNVNPIGPRSVYDEAKRFSEALTMAFRRTHGTNTGIVRIFNTFGPRMRVDDGRAIPAFVSQALRSEPLTVAGDGSQTRSLCYVTDLVRGLVACMRSGHEGPINLGNPHEVTMLELAEWIGKLAESESQVTFVDAPRDDPKVRRPDITRAHDLLGWAPQVPVEKGLQETIAWFRTVIA